MMNAKVKGYNDWKRVRILFIWIYSNKNNIRKGVCEAPEYYYY